MLPFWREAGLGLTAVAWEEVWRGHSRAELRGGELRFGAGGGPQGLTRTRVSSQEAPPVPGVVIQTYLRLEKSTSDVEGFFFPIALKGGGEEAGPQREAASWEMVSTLRDKMLPPPSQMPFHPPGTVRGGWARPASHLPRG